MLFLYFLPRILAAMNRFSGMVSISQIDFGVVEKFFIFQFCTLFLASCIAGSLLAQAGPPLGALLPTPHVLAVPSHAVLCSWPLPSPATALHTPAASPPPPWRLQRTIDQRPRHLQHLPLSIVFVLSFSSAVAPCAASATIPAAPWFPDAHGTHTPLRPTHWPASQHQPDARSSSHGPAEQ
jgi:hypothetical protein